MFQHCETKNFWRKILIPPLPFYSSTFWVPETSETRKGSSTKIFGTMRHKCFDGKTWYFPLPFLSKLFRYPKLMKHKRIPPYGNFRYCETKIFRRENLILPLSLIHKHFGYRKFSETQHRRVPLRKFSAPWDKKFSKKILILLPPSYP